MALVEQHRVKMKWDLRSPYFAEGMEDSERLPLRRVAQAVEAGEVTAGLLAELHVGFGASREKTQDQSHAEAVLDIAAELRMPIEKVEAGLAALEAQSRVNREVVMRRIALAWLEGQRKAYPRKDEL